MTIQYLNNGFAGGVKLVALAAHREVEDRQFRVVNPYAGSGMMPPDRYDAARNVRRGHEWKRERSPTRTGRSPTSERGVSTNSVAHHGWGRHPLRIDLLRPPR
jgi:hypothetical protein